MTFIEVNLSCVVALIFTSHHWHRSRLEAIYENLPLVCVLYKQIYVRLNGL